MKEQNVISTWFKNNWQSILNIAFVVLLILTLHTCNDNSDLKLAKVKSKNKEDKAKEKFNELAEKQKASDVIISFHEKKDKEQEVKIKELEKRRIIVVAQTKERQNIAKTYTKDEKAIYWGNFYQLPNEVKTVESGIEVTEKIASLTIDDLIEGKGALQELELTQKQIYLFQDRISEKDKIIGQYEEKGNTFNMMIAQKDTIIEAKQDLIKAQEKSLRKRKISSTFWKVTTIAAASFLTYELIKK